MGEQWGDIVKMSRVVYGVVGGFSSGGGFGLLDSVYEWDSLNHVR